MIPDKLEISTWVTIGGIRYTRANLPSSHPESMYACIKRLGRDPEDYGYFETEEPQMPPSTTDGSYTGF